MDAAAIADALREIALRLRLAGGESHRARAYEGGAAAIEALGTELDARLREGSLTELAGIGQSLAGVITELATAGRSGLLERLRQEMPAQVLELAQVPEVGPARARLLVTELGIGSLDELTEAARDGRLRSLRGIGPATEARIRDGLRRFARRRDRVILLAARKLAEPLRAHLEAGDRIDRVALGGEVARWCETVADLELVVAAASIEAACARLAEHPLTARTEVAGTEVIGHLATGTRVRLHVVAPGRFAAALVRHTSDADHARELAARAGGAIEDLAAASEAEVYAAAGLPLIPVELREGSSAITAAEGGRLPTLITDDDVAGMVHCHTVWSDGKHDIEAMARAAEAIGMEYLTITDHSAAAHYAGGLDRARLEAQWQEIAEVSERVGVRILRGTEADILADGRLDWPDDLLVRFEIIIASLHSQLRLEAAAMTRRLIAALRQPVFKIWGHPLARMLLRRDPVACDRDRVLDAAAEGPAALEINGDPHRLDPPADWIRAARDRGLRFVLSTDAHSVRGMRALRFAVAQARRGWLSPGDVLNCGDAESFVAAVRPTR